MLAVQMARITKLGDTLASNHEQIPQYSIKSYGEKTGAKQ